MKRIICILAAVLLVALTLASCGEAGGRLDPLDAGRITLVTASESIFSSYMYLIEDEGAISELVGLYNDLTYDTQPDAEIVAELMADTLYMISYHEETAVDGVIPVSIATLWISPKGYLLLEDEGDSTLKAYKLTSSFDEERVLDLLTKYDTTPDLNIIVK